ncbi:hypothetical protein EDB84DRAFT_1443762 [Lactarius hengduanensis]|nr:hypothetical protein EDB84DRAFT_1443762 [Lactarius hengduanensis]
MEARLWQSPAAHKGLGLLLMLSGVGCGEPFACLTDKELVHLPEDEVALLMDLGKVHRTVHHLPLLQRRRLMHPVPHAHQAPLLDRQPPVKMCPRYAGLLLSQGRPHEACCWVRMLWSLDCPQGQPSCGPRCLPSAGRRSESSCAWWSGPYEQAGKGSANGVSSRGSGPMVPLKLSDSGDGFLTVRRKARSQGQQTFVDVASNVMADLHASALRNFDPRVLRFCGDELCREHSEVNLGFVTTEVSGRSGKRKPRQGWSCFLMRVSPETQEPEGSRRLLWASFPEG